LKDSSARDWRDAYLEEVFILQKTAKPGEEIIVIKLPSKKQGQPILFGKNFDKYLQQKLRLIGMPIGTSAVIGIGLGILKKH